MSALNIFKPGARVLYLLFALVIVAGAVAVSGCGGGGGSSSGSSATTTGKTMEINGTVGENSPIFMAPAKSSTDDNIYVTDLDDARISGASASFTGASSFKAVVPIGSVTRNLMLVISNKTTGAIIYRNILGKLPSESDVSTTKITLSNVRVNEETTAKSVILLEDRTKIPDAFITTADISVKTQFETQVDSMINDPDGSRIITPLKTAISTVSKAVATSNAEAVKIRTTFLKSTTNLLNSFVTIAKARETDDTLKAVIPTAPTVSINNTTLDRQSTDSQVTAVVTAVKADVKPKAASPKFDPAAGNYEQQQSVAISCSTPGATIIYTTDGTLPSTTNGENYSLPITVSTSTVIKAIAVKDGYSDSDAACSTYTIGASPLAAAAPSFNPASGIYTTALSVAISTETQGATIKYTTDGSEPSQTAGSVYYSPISVSTGITIKAIAYKSGMSDSPVTTSTYVIQNPELTTVAAPVFTPPQGAYQSAQTLIISSTTPGATIYYRTDGNAPSRTYGLVFSAPISVSANSIVKAFAVKEGMTDSAVSTANYVIQAQGGGTVSTPVMSPNGGIFGTAQQVTIYTATSGAYIRYTTDGSTPTESTGNLYSSPITVSANSTVKAIAYKSGMGTSQVASASFTFQSQVGTPAINPGGGVYSEAQQVSISCATAGATVIYTTDGSTPSSSNGLVYTSPITVAYSLTVRAIAVKSGMADSSPAAAIFTINLPVSAPVMSPPAGTYSSAQSVSVTSATSGATIIYTLDGSAPSRTNGQTYSGPVAVNSSSTLKAFAYKSGLSDSAVSSASYIILSPAAAPSFNPVPGSYGSTQNVSMTTATAGATIRYTLDGSTPSKTNGITYAWAVPISSYTILKAIAVKDGLADSSVSSGIYDIQTTVATPTFNLPAGTYTGTQQLLISSATAGATIKYTKDGSLPSSTNGSTYFGSVTVSETSTIKAVAIKNGMIDSAVNSVAFTIKAVAPAFNPPGGTYTSGQSVSLSTATTGATVVYTTDGSDPSRTNGTTYTGAVSVSANSTLKAFAYKSGLTDSSVSSATYVFQQQVAQPIFGVQGGTYSSAQSVAIVCATTGATIVYTLDGSTPSQTNGTVYSGAVGVSYSATLKAIAIKSGMVASGVASADYVILNAVATPSFDPSGGTFTGSKSVTISCATSGASIIYTTNGTTPSAVNGTSYSGAITVASSITLRAIATKSGMNDSGVSTTNFVIKTQPPASNPAEGTYSSAQSVTLSTSTSGASIRFTTDGSTPSKTAGTLYSGAAISVPANTTIKAVAYKDGQSVSDISSFVFTILSKVSQPVISPNGGSFTTAQQVTVSCATPGATIKYTTDGAEPSLVYGETYYSPFTVSNNYTIKAKAFKSGMADSNLASASFLILTPAVKPVISPSGGTISAPTQVTLASTTPGASIRYTTDGSDPSDTLGTLYSGAFTVSTSTNVRAIAYKSGMGNSEIASASFTFMNAVLPPSFSPNPGVYSSEQSVTITTPTDGATIKYTTNGTTPSSTVGTTYTVPITVSSTQTIKAIAVKTGMIDSSVTSAAYTINIPQYVAMPYFSPAPGTYTTAQTVLIYCNTPDVIIKYTTDGSTPSKTDGSTYTQPIVVNTNRTIKAMAYKFDGSMLDSQIYSGSYTIANPVATPTFNPPEGTYSAAQSVTISCATPGTTIMYTTDGSNPSKTSGVQYSGAISIDSSATVKAMAFKTDGTMDDSPVASATYNIQEIVNTPTFSPEPGTFATAQSVTIICTTENAIIKYTTDGSVPSRTAGNTYAGPITVAATTTIKAMAYANNKSDSAVATGIFTIVEAVATPTFNPPAGTYPTAQNVAISCTTAGATIKYTTDGSVPSATNGTAYSQPLSVQNNLTIKAIAIKTGMPDSSVATADYTISSAVANPVFTPAGGTFTGSQSISITCATQGATIKYTTDGTTAPSKTVGTTYTGAINVSATTTIKAIAFKDGFSDSQVVTSAYTINDAGSILVALQHPPVVSPETEGQLSTLAPQATMTVSDATGVNVVYVSENPTRTYNYRITGVPVGQRTVTVNFPNHSTSGNSTVTVVKDGEVSVTLTLAEGESVATPTFDPEAGTYGGAQSVTIGCTTVGATIRYTTDGSEPSQTNGTVYSGAVNVAANLTLKAIAYKTGMNDSAIASAQYTISLGTVATPLITPPGNSYSMPMQVSISCSTDGSIIRYTTDGTTTPSDTVGNIYTGPFQITTTTTVKAIAYKTGMTNSAIVTATFTALTPVETPTFNPDGGTFYQPTLVTISCATAGATIKYTTDGTDPSPTNGITYNSTDKARVTRTGSLKAIAFKDGMGNSAIKSSGFVLFTLTTAVFEDGGTIPTNYAKSGFNFSPPFVWNGAPAATQSFALICSDDVNNTPADPNDDYYHWIIYGMPASAGGVKENVPKAAIALNCLIPTGDAYQGLNDDEAGNHCWYDGPNPPVGGGVHTYNFSLLALDLGTTAIPAGSSKFVFGGSVSGHILGTAVYTGKFSQ